LPLNGTTNGSSKSEVVSHILSLSSQEPEGRVRAHIEEELVRARERVVIYEEMLRLYSGE
jgi:hypothetical protein